MATSQNKLCFACERPPSKKGLIPRILPGTTTVVGLMCGKCIWKILSKERMAERRAKDPEGVKAYNRQWAKDNPEQVKVHAKKAVANSRKRDPDKIKNRQANWVEKNRDRLREKSRTKYQAEKHLWRERELRVKFGITSVQYDELLEAQGGVCCLCKGLPGKRAYSVDHDHVTGVIRGLLCRGCNVGIGNLKDNPDLLEAAARYIRTTRTTFVVPSQLGNVELGPKSDSDT